MIFWSSSLDRSDLHLRNPPPVSAIVRQTGPAAVFAANEFFYGNIRNEHTRVAYRRAVDRFLAWCEQRGLELARIAPGDVGQYFDGLRKKNLSVATRKQHLAAVRHFFDGMIPMLFGSLRACCTVISGGLPRSVPRGPRALGSERPALVPRASIDAFNRRASESESLVARSLATAGASWGGVMLWDDLRALDYLASRPEVDPRRLASVGLSVGGYRSFLLAALDERIKAAVAVGWMTSFGSQVRRHVIHSIGHSFHLAGLQRSLDFPDLAALIAPRALLVINGSRDRLFAPDGVRAAFSKISECYEKAGAPGLGRCRLYDAPHEFNLQMQSEAWAWFRGHL